MAPQDPKHLQLSWWLLFPTYQETNLFLHLSVILKAGLIPFRSPRERDYNRVSTLQVHPSFKLNKSWDILEKILSELQPVKSSQPDENHRLRKQEPILNTQSSLLMILKNSSVPLSEVTKHSQSYLQGKWLTSESPSQPFGGDFLLCFFLIRKKSAGLPHLCKIRALRITAALTEK